MEDLLKIVAAVALTIPLAFLLIVSVGAVMPDLLGIVDKIIEKTSGDK